MSLPNIDTGRGAEGHGRIRSPQTNRGIAAKVVGWTRQAVGSRFYYPVLLLVAAFVIYLPRLDYPEKYLFDEILFAYTAGEYVEGNVDSYRWDHPCSVTKNDERCAELYPEAMQDTRVGKYQWAHPPLGKLFMAGGIILFGNDSFGWRIPSVICGAIGIVIAYYLGLTLTGRESVGVLTAGFLLLDGLYFVYSRIGLVDIFLVVSTMATLLAFARYLAAPPERARTPLLWMGTLLGLSTATKWSAAYGAFFIGLVVLWRVVRLWQGSRRAEAPADVRAGFWQHLIWAPIALVVIPLAIYMLAYLPFFLGGNNTMSDFIELQKTILHLQTNLDTDPRTASRWWTWPLNLRSVWFGTRNFADDRVAITYALGNPFLYWAFLPAVGWTALRWWRSGHSIALTVLMVGFFGQWLPWLFVGRASYLYHFLPAVPFGCLAVAATVVHLCRTFSDWRRTLAIEYVVLVALAFGFFYPIVSFYPISEHALEMRLWLSSWR